MKQSNGSVYSSTMLTSLENEVVEILVELPTRIWELECGCRFPFTWGHKRRRSAIRVTPSPSTSPFHPQPTTSSPSLPKAEASSPATPLSFSPSESEEKPTLLRKNVSLKRKREHYLKIIEELTKDNHLLHGEIKNVKCYLEQLKEFNLKLKERKQELSAGPKVYEQVQSQFPDEAHPSPLFGVAQCQIEEACGEATTSLGMASSSGSALGNNNKMGPIGIPDLNLLPVEECYEALDASVANKNLSRAIAAQARQKRIQICKVKNVFANSKMRYSCT